MWDKNIKNFDSNLWGEGVVGSPEKVDQYFFDSENLYGHNR